MSLEIKSDENLAIIEYSGRKKRYYSATAGRAYYAVFQRMKHYLVSEKFDYDKFLSDNGLDEKPYSHGTIKLAFSKYLVGKGTNLQVLNTVNKSDYLYRTRRKADYKDDLISEKEFVICLSIAQEIIETIKTI